MRKLYKGWKRLGMYRDQNFACLECRFQSWTHNCLTPSTSNTLPAAKYATHRFTAPEHILNPAYVALLIQPQLRSNQASLYLEIISEEG